MARILIAGLPLAALSACSLFAPDEWEGFVYPNRNDLTNHISIGVFQSLDQCRDAATAKLESLGAQRRGDYECGLNCRFEAGMGDLRICDKTLR